MLNSIIYSCVKCVKNYWITVRKTCGLLSTNIHVLVIKTTDYVCKPIVYRFTIPLLSTELSTCKNRLFNLLNKSFTHYPQYLLLEPLKEN